MGTVDYRCLELSRYLHLILGIVGNRWEEKILEPYPRCVDGHPETAVEERKWFLATQRL